MAKPFTFERMNTHDSMFVEVEVLGHNLRLAQDPNTEHLGTTVWDASIVLAKMLEKNQRKGEFSRSKLVGKRAIELGAGMGLGGIALSLLGADVTLTDTVDVLPLLKRNCEMNLGTNKVHVCELDWMQPEQVAPLQPPFDIVIAADCIYHEHIVPHFHSTVLAVTNHKSTVVVVNELRSHSVHQAFMDAFTATHTVKRMPANKLDEQYQHPLIHVYICKLKKKTAGGTAADGAAQDSDVDEDQISDVTDKLGHTNLNSTGRSDQTLQKQSLTNEVSTEPQPQTKLSSNG